MARRVFRAATAIFHAGRVDGCLERSLAIARALGACGLSPEVVVGYSRHIGHGHAWVELSNLPVLDDATAKTEFAELWRVDREGRILTR